MTQESNTPNDIVMGRNPVLQALSGDREMEKLLVQQGAQQGSIQTIITKAKKQGLVVQEVNKVKLDFLAQQQNVHAHQGVALLLSAVKYYQLDELVAQTKAGSNNPVILLLDGVTDPHNIGAALRSAHCLGAAGVLLPKRRSGGLGAAAAKASAGAVEHIPVARVGSPLATVEDFKQRGFWTVAADISGQPARNVDLTGPILLVMGAEGRGLSPAMLSACDLVAALPDLGEIGSLNVSVAAAVLLYERLRQMEAKDA